MAIAKAPSSSDLASTLARDWALQVNTGTKDAPKWTYVRGLSQFAPELKPKMQDDSDIDSEGYGSQIATALEMSFKGEGKRKGTDADGVFKQDPGQAFIRNAGRKMGLKNVIQARAWRTDGVQEGYEAHFSVEWEEKAGKNDDLDEFSFTMMSRGKPLAIKPVESDSAASVPVDNDSEFRSTPAGDTSA